MKILHISDTHLHPLEPILDGYEADVLVHSGDGLNSGSESEGYKFLKDWKAATSRFKYKIYIPGNHCKHYGKYPTMWKDEFAQDGSIYLDMSGKEIEGVYFWGHTMIPPINGHWYGEREEHERRRGLSFIPNHEKLVLISHGPPYMIMDSIIKEPVWGGMPYFSPNWGCPALREFLYDRTVPVLACLSGHIHNGRLDGPTYEMETKNGKTIISNASICDESYEPIFKPVMIELEV